MVRLIVLALVLILALSYFGISIREIAESPTGEENLSYAWEQVKIGWQLFLAFIADLAGEAGSVFR